MVNILYYKIFLIYKFIYNLFESSPFKNILTILLSYIHKIFLPDLKINIIIFLFFIINIIEKTIFLI